MTKDWQKALNVAVEAYKNGQPVVVRSTEGNVLHGREFLESVIDLKLTLKAFVIEGIPQEEYEATDWPERLEAARIVFLKDGWPKGHD